MSSVRGFFLLVCLALAGTGTVAGQTAPAAPQSITYLGITPNRFAEDPNNTDVFVQRFQETVSAGVTFVVGGSSWADLEPAEGQYQLDSLKYLAWSAGNSNLPVCYTVRIIDNVRRGVPSDLQDVAFDDPRMVTRMLKLIDAIAPIMRGRVSWFALGYEIDPYFDRHPEEIQAFVNLQAIVAAHLKALLPDIPVGSTLTFAGIDELNSSLWQLNQQVDFLSLTYCPFYPGFIVMDPGVVPSDIARMKDAAAGRKIVLQEIAYPTALLNDSSEDRQADFYRTVFNELQADPAPFAAVNVMILGDISDDDASAVAASYGVDMPAFKSALQTLGLFDGVGRPKAAWRIVTSNLGKNRWKRTNDIPTLSILRVE
jgi:hypothetical protein